MRHVSNAPSEQICVDVWRKNKGDVSEAWESVEVFSAIYGNALQLFILDTVIRATADETTIAMLQAVVKAAEESQ